ncbi:uncharacterized protein N7484_006931 [Penicillium longicatenatum]|uniref:uncharacterized protein n=1 Tax=Penicillium longicatenatum TaxID=1561947 RepID=UPI0025473984|nr:uncharacterized protein N7484_006931 [Penicillium longicatenatum]KAJ5639069.1 hypothetical protein N7484_006931 [Penicillium longicatenatum]
MVDSTKLTAAQKVLSTYELISEILQNTIDATSETSQHSPSSWYSMLAKYSRINKSWCREAMRLLWPNGTAVKHCSLIQVLASVEPSRRQFYANYIQSACFVDVCKANIRKNNKILRGMVFPKLQYLAVIIKQHYRQKLWMPYLNAPRLEALKIRLATVQWTGQYRNVKATFGEKNRRGPSLQSSIAIRLIRRIQVRYMSRS